MNKAEFVEKLGKKAEANQEGCDQGDRCNVRFDHGRVGEE